VGLARSAKRPSKLTGYALRHLLIDQPPGLPCAARLRAVVQLEEATDAPNEWAVIWPTQLAAEETATKFVGAVERVVVHARGREPIGQVASRVG
jgi:hypothetical protein